VIHHSAIVTTDVDASLRFWRDGLGFTVLFDQSFDGDWPALFGAETSTLRAVFLGDPSRLDAGIVELVAFEAEQVPDGEAARLRPTTGFFLLSVFTDVAAALTRLADLGLGGEPRRTTTAGVAMAVVQDPNGVLVELVDTGAQDNLERMP
jgi:catechol 2,3-dioxygenase-like lactoylglutathione lyase family enzyme